MTRVRFRSPRTRWWTAVVLGAALGAARASMADDAPAAPLEPAEREIFNENRLPLLAWIAGISGATTIFVWRSRRGKPPTIRRIAALEAVDEAIGRATEMGRPVLFIPGIQDMDNIQTVAGITMLGRVSRTAAEYDAVVEAPTCRSLVMEAAREAVQASCLAAGRPDAYQPDRINYITDEQFGYVAFVGGKMMREKPAACFYMGCFFAESLIFSETGNAIGAIQIAGTAESSQLPFFVAACDYTLIGEEFFAASAYLSGEPDQLGTLQAQDSGKLAVIMFVVIGATVSTIAALAPSAGDLAGFSAFLQKALGG
ncbi:MAG: DUF6754 domain-containing protein [Planctomycetota bacterium]